MLLKVQLAQIVAVDVINHSSHCLLWWLPMLSINCTDCCLDIKQHLAKITREQYLQIKSNHITQRSTGESIRRGTACTRIFQTSRLSKKMLELLNMCPKVAPTGMQTFVKWHSGRHWYSKFLIQARIRHGRSFDTANVVHLPAAENAGIQGSPIQQVKHSYYL